MISKANCYSCEQKWPKLIIRAKELKWSKTFEVSNLFHRFLFQKIIFFLCFYLRFSHFLFNFIIHSTIGVGRFRIWGGGGGGKV